MEEPMRLALTFDDGPGPATPRLLEVLRAHRVRATSSCSARTSSAPATWPSGWRATATCSATTAGRTRRPMPSPRRTSSRKSDATDGLLAEIRRAAGFAAEPGPFPVRLPYGPQPDNPRLRALASMGRTHVHWTGDFQDWVKPAPDPQALATAMRAHVSAQTAARLDAVLDLHDSSRLFEDRTATAEAVESAPEDALPAALHGPGGELKGR